MRESVLSLHSRLWEQFGLRACSVLLMTQSVARSCIATASITFCRRVASGARTAPQESSMTAAPATTARARWWSTLAESSRGSSRRLTLEEQSRHAARPHHMLTTRLMKSYRQSVRPASCSSSRESEMPTAVSETTDWATARRRTVAKRACGLARRRRADAYPILYRRRESPSIVLGACIVPVMATNTESPTDVNEIETPARRQYWPADGVSPHCHLVELGSERTIHMRLPLLIP